MHDITNIESRGIPGLVIASSVFQEAAEAQAQALGFAPPMLYVPHPIQDRTDDEMRQIADQALDKMMALLTA